MPTIASTPNRRPAATKTAGTRRRRALAPLVAAGSITALSPLADVPIAIAEQHPVALAADGRIKRFSYNEHTVYRLDTHTNFITTVQFGPAESVQSIQLGASASWQIVRLKRGDVDSIKPLNADAATNMTIYTDRRVYSFELRARRGRSGADSGQNYRVAFTYPTTGTVSECALAAFGPGGRTSPPNRDYRIAGSAAFAPSEVWDDGTKTYFRFPTDAPRPAMFSVGRFGREALVNLRADGDHLVADGVHGRWTVRLGDDALCIASGRTVRRARTERERTDA